MNEDVTTPPPPPPIDALKELAIKQALLVLTNFTEPGSKYTPQDAYNLTSLALNANSHHHNSSKPVEKLHGFRSFHEPEQSSKSGFFSQSSRVSPSRPVFIQIPQFSLSRTLAPLHSGVQNYGLTCFAGVLLQLFNSIPDRNFDALFGMQSATEAYNHNAFSFQKGKRLTMGKLTERETEMFIQARVRDLLRSLRLDCRVKENVLSLIHLLSWYEPSYMDRSRQHDAGEMLANIMAGLFDKDLDFEHSAIIRTRETTFTPNNPACGKIDTQVALNDDIPYMLILDLKNIGDQGKVQLSTIIEEFQESTTSRENVFIQCPPHNAVARGRCLYEKRDTITVNYDFAAPPVLFFVFPRITQGPMDSHASEKNNFEVDFNIGQVITLGKHKFKITSFAEHLSRIAESGHWVATCMSREDVSTDDDFTLRRYNDTSVSKATEISSNSKKNVHVITAVNMNFKRQDSEEMSDFDNTSVGGDYDLLLPTDSTNGHLSSQGDDSTDMSSQKLDPNSMQADDGSGSSKGSVHSSPLSQVPPVLTSSLTSLKSPTMVLPLSQKRT